MKINWQQIKNESRRQELKKVARKMRNRGYEPQLANWDGKWALEGKTPTGGYWVA